MRVQRSVILYRNHLLEVHECCCRSKRASLCRLAYLLVSYKPLAPFFSELKAPPRAMLAVGSEGLGRDGLCVIKGRREAQRLKQKKRDRKKQAPVDIETADARTLLFVLGGFLLALFVVTKMALGL